MEVLSHKSEVYTVKYLFTLAPLLEFWCKNFSNKGGASKLGMYTSFIRSSKSSFFMWLISYTLIGELLQNRAVMKQMEGNILWNLHVNDNFTFYRLLIFRTAWPHFSPARHDMRWSQLTATERGAIWKGKYTTPNTISISINRVELIRTILESLSTGTSLFTFAVEVWHVFIFLVLALFCFILVFLFVASTKCKVGAITEYPSTIEFLKW